MSAVPHVSRRSVPTVSQVRVSLMFLGGALVLTVIKMETNKNGQSLSPSMFVLHGFTGTTVNKAVYRNSNRHQGCQGYFIGTMATKSASQIQLHVQTPRHCRHYCWQSMSQIQLQTPRTPEALWVQWSLMKFLDRDFSLSSGLKDACNVIEMSINELWFLYKFLGIREREGREVFLHTHRIYYFIHSFSS